VNSQHSIVSFGVVRKALLEVFDIKQEVLYADFNWDTVVSLAGKNKVLYKEIPKYPEVRRDMSLLLDEGTSFAQVYEIAGKVEKKLLKQINLFDVYTGEKLPKGKKSYALSFTIQDDKATLTDPQVDKIMHKLQDRFEKELGAVLR
jgi:phenylalanyl-tRNA synthetase beta chain